MHARGQGCPLWSVVRLIRQTFPWPSRATRACTARMRQGGRCRLGAYPSDVYAHTGGELRRHVTNAPGCPHHQQSLPLAQTMLCSQGTPVVVVRVSAAHRLRAAAAAPRVGCENQCRSAAQHKWDASAPCGAQGRWPASYGQVGARLSLKTCHYLFYGYTLTV